MRIPVKLIERIVDRITEELTAKRYIEAEDINQFRENVFKIIKEAIEEEKELVREAEKLVEENINKIDEEISFRDAVRKVKQVLAEKKGIHLDPEERMNQVAHRIKKYIEEDDSIEIFEHPNKIRKKIFYILRDLVKEEKEIDREVRRRIRSYSRKIIEGTAEWNILYEKIYKEILRRKGLE
jgi:hypothetical protein